MLSTSARAHYTLQMNNNKKYQKGADDALNRYLCLSPGLTYNKKKKKKKDRERLRRAEVKMDTDSITERAQQRAERHSGALQQFKYIRNGKIAKASSVLPNYNP